MADLHFGLLVPQGWKNELDGLGARAAYDTMIDGAVRAERAGFDSLWVYDHFHAVPPPPGPTPVFESFTALAAIAERTERAAIGQMVTCAPYRNPGLIAKMGACIDVASNGRFQMGLGAGWYWDEYNAYGYGFPDPPERLGILADTLEIVKRMWADERASYDGRYASIEGALCDPKPLQQPRPPIWVGGAGEKVTLRLTATHADWANFGGKPHEFEHKRDVVRSHCDAVGRDPATIRLSLHQDCVIAPDERALAALLEAHPPIWGEELDSYRRGHLVGTPSQIVERIGEYTALGAEGFILWFPDLPSSDGYELFASEVIPALRR